VQCAALFSCRFFRLFLPWAPPVAWMHGMAGRFSLPIRTLVALAEAAKAIDNQRKKGWERLRYDR
jgi:hypothetical protein